MPGLPLSIQRLPGANSAGPPADCVLEVEGVNGWSVQNGWVMAAATAVGAAAGVLLRRRRGTVQAPVDAAPALEPFGAHFHRSAIPLLVTSAEGGRIVDANAAAQALAGRTAEALRGSSAVATSPAETAAERDANLRALEALALVDSRDFRLKTAAGDEIRLVGHTTPIEVDGQPYQLAAVSSVMPLASLEENLLYSQRMEVIGKLSGGVAHQFNNLLTVMQGHLDALAAEVPPSPTLLRRVETLRRSVAEATQITSGLLTFAGRNPVEPTVVDLKAALDDLAPVVDGVLGATIALAWDHGNEPLPVTIAQPQVAQLVLNLALNARDAMPEGGRLAIATRRLTRAAGEPPGAGAWVALTVRDTGHGMSDEVRQHIFEPFFSTKSPGQATGLGLSICLGIVEQAGGHISAVSAPGQGTTIEVHLPLADAPAASDPATRLDRIAPAGMSIMLVEDEADVRDIVAEILRRAGHVVHALDSLAAVHALLSRQAPRLDLLVTDLVLPGGNGLDVARLITATYPGLPVLFISGYSEAVFSGGETVEHLLQKPFTARTLLNRVHELRGVTRRVAAS